MVVIDERVGSAQLDRLAEGLAPPCQIGDYVLEGLISRTSTALIFVVRGGAFAEGEGVLKLTGHEYAPLLQRELDLLNLCRDADVHSVIRPVRYELEWIDVDAEADEPVQVAALLLPFLSGGDLVQWVGSHATRTGHLGPQLALRVGELVGGVLRALLHQSIPVVHGDVKPQNVLLPYPGAPVGKFVVIDLDASEQLDLQLEDVANAPRETAQRLINDVNGFGELLFILATGREPPSEDVPDPATDNPAFNALVVNCLTSEALKDGAGYVCMADNGLWRDLEKALAFERSRKRPRRTLMSLLLNRRSLAALGVALLGGLIMAIASKLPLA